MSSNLLHKEQSPYLLQHADNPVHWHAWNEEAFELAKARNKPVFLSIGYATCHWCHVMAHESFEDQQIADMMNEAFINIKVDREERPDIDNIYMTVCQMLTGHGGWPLTIIMTPDKKPFFAATYIPKDSRQGRIGMRQLIPAIDHHWNNEFGSIEKAITSIEDGFRKQQQFIKTDTLSQQVINDAIDQLKQQFDVEHGGFGSAPKFPTPHNLILLLRQAFLNKDHESLEMASKTLTEMRCGGIFDQIGYGFHRYSTDREWVLPHFEKMLYDQALLMMAYTEAYQLTKNDLFKQTVYEISEYVQRDLSNPDGAYYSAEDADSEGVEGKFYTWTFEELESILNTDEIEILVNSFNLRKEGNFLDESSRELTGSNILYLNTPEVLSDSKLKPIRSTLFNHRKKRIRPLLDDKILTDWNALMIAAYAKAAFVFNDDTFKSYALKGISFIENNLISGKKLLHRYRKGEAGIEAFADDYAFLIWALLECYHCTLNSEYLQKAVDWNRVFLDTLYDENDGGFFFSRNEDSEAMGSQKMFYDGAVPSSNSVALMNQLKLFKYTGDSSFAELSEQIMKLFGAHYSSHGSHYTMAMQAFQFAYMPSQEIVLSETDKNATNPIEDFLELMRERYLPNSILMRRPQNEEDAIYKLSSFINEQKPRKNTTTAFVCENFSCKNPVTQISDFKEILDRISE